MDAHIRRQVEFIGEVPNGAFDFEWASALLGQLLITLAGQDVACIEAEEGLVARTHAERLVILIIDVLSCSICEGDGVRSFLPIQFL